MELKFTIDTDDLYGEDVNFESLLTSSLRQEVMKNCKTDLVSDKFKEFAELTSDTIVAGVKLKMENFLSEEIALVDRWGKKIFVGSIEDLMKKRFDDVLLRSVDNKGRTIQGCTTSDNPTWIEWKIENFLEGRIHSFLKEASRKLSEEMEVFVIEKIAAIKKELLETQVERVIQATKKGNL